jgi:spermidine synthase
LDTCCVRQSNITLFYSGLGAGISTQAFQQHGLNTTIVEIDPAVYKAAREYFGLGDPGSDRVFLEDARGWVARRRASLSSASATSAQEKFDIVVHDCFSGGGVPQHIFTAEFWNDLQASMSPDGVLVVVSSTLFVF